MQLYQVVIFDWEGTLGDTLGQVIMAIQTAVQRCNLPPFDEILARQSFNTGIRFLLKKLYPHLSDEEQVSLLDMVEQQLNINHSKVYLLPGAKDFVKTLFDSDKKLAIATNKNNMALQRDLQLTDLESFFKITRCANQTMPKPNPQMLEEILYFFQVPVKNALMIGDSESDIIMARAIGMDVVGIDPSNQDKLSLINAGAKEVFQNYKSLSAWFFNVKNEEIG